MLKYLALDIGNVLCYCNSGYFAKTLSQKFNISVEEGREFIDKIQKPHDIGITSLKQELIKTFNIKAPSILEELEKQWKSIPNPCSIILNYLSNLPYNVKIALLSNIGPEHAEVMVPILSIFKLNPIKHYSCEVGARKPSLLYFQSFLSLYPEFKNCLYIDDLLDNLETGQKLGFKTLHFDLHKDDVGKFINNVDNYLKGDI